MTTVKRVMQIYVAGASSNIEMIEKFIALLKLAGFEITFDWTVAVRTAGDASPDDPKIRIEAANADLRGVETAEIVWVLQPDATSTSTGAWVELGSAITWRQVRRETFRQEATRPIVVVSGVSKKCIFSDKADYRFLNHDDAFAFIKGRQFSE